MVDDIRSLLGNALLGLGADRLDDLRGLLAHLVPGELRVLEQLDGVAALGTPALTRDSRGDLKSLPRKYRLIGGTTPTAPNAPGSGNDGFRILSSCCRTPSTRSVCS